MFPKQTQLQNSTLRTHMPVSIVRWVARPPSMSGPAAAWLVEFRLRNSDEYPAGVGMNSKFSPISNTEPAEPTAAERRKPGFDRSIRYHRKGLTIAKVMETCIVDAHGTFLCGKGWGALASHEFSTLLEKER